MGHFLQLSCSATRDLTERVLETKDSLPFFCFRFLPFDASESDPELSDDSESESLEPDPEEPSLLSLLLLSLESESLLLLLLLPLPLELALELESESDPLPLLLLSSELLLSESESELELLSESELELLSESESDEGAAPFRFFLFFFPSAPSLSPAPFPTVEPSFGASFSRSSGSRSLGSRYRRVCDTEVGGFRPCAPVDQQLIKWECARKQESLDAASGQVWRMPKATVTCEC